jgi:hypothetical protein
MLHTSLIHAPNTKVCASPFSSFECEIWTLSVASFDYFCTVTLNFYSILAYLKVLPSIQMLPFIVE